MEYTLWREILAHIELFNWQCAHIEEGLRQAEAGEFATEIEVAKVFRRELVLGEIQS